MDSVTVPDFISNILGAPMGIIIMVGVVVLSALYALLLGKDKITREYDNRYQNYKTCLL